MLTRARDSQIVNRFAISPPSSGLSMSFILQPWQLFFMILASWVHREQQKIIEFYQAQLRALMEAQGKKRLLADR